jgi:tetratricopeptide (TPR) repeat protein
MKAATLLALAGLAAAAAPARADDPGIDRARSLTARGRELHDKGDYRGAIAVFQEAYVLAPRPGLLFNLAQAYRLEGNCDAAELMYRRYLAASPSREERTIAESHLAAVARCARRGVAVADPRVPAASGAPHDGRPESPGADRRARGRLVKRIGLGASIGGAAALSVAAYFGARAYSAQEDVERRYAAGTPWPQLEATHARGERDAETARWVGIGGAATAATGLALFFFGRHAEHTAPIAIVPAGRGARIGVAWAF